MFTVVTNREEHHRLGVDYATGIGGDIDPDRSKLFHDLAKGEGDKVAMTPGDHHRLGIAYEMGVGGGIDKDKAKYWFLRAARADCIEAQVDCGHKYLESSGYFGFDAKKAVHWFNKAAEHNSAQAEYMLGRIYYTGWGEVEKNIQASLKWHTLAAEQGHEEAGKSIQACLFEG